MSILATSSAKLGKLANICFWIFLYKFADLEAECSFLTIFSLEALGETFVIFNL